MPNILEPGNINGISYGTINTGTKSDKILIFLPGIGAFKENYVKHAQSFKELYSFIYLLDLPEQGSRGDWQIGVMVEQIAEFIGFIDTPEIKRIDLAGHSAGALAIISFLANYNSHAETKVLESVTTIDAAKAIMSIPSLNGTGFSDPVPEMAKVKKLMLYAPPDSFDNVFDRIYSIGLSGISEKTVRRILNLVVNRPMLFLSIFSSSPYFRFRLDRSGKPQYFRFVIGNHVRFLKYSSEYLTIFEIFRGLEPADRERLVRIISDREILVQYGTADWVVKPSMGRHRGYEKNIAIAENIKFVRHRHLGHMLNHRFRPDVNMNLQMVTDSDVISKSIDFIND